MKIRCEDHVVARVTIAYLLILSLSFILPYTQATAWYPVTLGILSVLATMDTRWYIQLAKAAPYPLACVLFSHYWDLKEYGFRIAPAAYSECWAQYIYRTTFACLLFAHYWDLKEFGFRIALAAYSECWAQCT